MPKNKGESEHEKEIMGSGDERPYILLLLLPLLLCLLCCRHGVDD